MLSCASPAGMPPAPHSSHPPAWFQQPPIVKSEPMEDVNFSKDQTSGFYSGFHSASPSSSSKDSNGHSPRSVGSGGDPTPFYDNVPLKAKANLGMHLASYRNNLPYNLLTPPGFETRNANGREPSPGYENSYSPRSIAPPAHVSTPLARASSTPPKSPPRTPSSDREREQDGRSYDRFHDSGFDIQSKNDGDDGREGSGLEEDFDDEPGLRVPAVNSHGKVKTFKCKQCEFVAVTKLSFWEHSKEHIKPEKMLSCRKCPFVTEYKHHLEYHMRNHMGSKPFQCTQCSYSCVNKSMLNSHLKSHSNVYQYRCSDCNYATKYCHSLKLHLRKYQHNPAMVLNVDGTPNPLPIIDVYGTRRGPKQKPISSQMFEKPLNINNNNPPQPSTPTHPLFGGHFPINLPYLPPLLPHSFLFPPNNNYEQRTSPKPSELQIEKQSPPPPLSILHQRLSIGEPPSESMSPPAKSPLSVPTTPTVPRSVTPVQINDALDLTSTKTSEAGSPPPSEKVAPPVTPTTLKNRRKGRAFKLQPAALRLQHEDDKREAEASDCESETSADTPTSTAQNYQCQYCDITFGDLTMHTIHMGFHGYNDPFMCNKCGERSGDKVAFFIHLGRAQHA